MDNRNPQAQGRARGRGKPQDPNQQPRRPGERPQGQQRPVGAQARPQAWGGQVPTPAQSQQSAWGQQAAAPAPSVRPGAPPAQQAPRPSAPAEVEKGRGKSTMPRPVPSEAGPSSSGSPPGSRDGNGGNGDSARGAMRGRRQIYDIVRTKPETVNSKMGKVGTPITLTANYFRLIRSPKWHIYQYRVDFAPEIEHMMVRKGLVGSQKANLGGYLFDGTMLFLTRKLPNDTTEMYSTRRDGEQIRITVKFVGEISMTDGTALQILNLILRRAMEGLKLQLVGRNFFDAVASININEFRLQLWPGYQTSIRQHEADILLCAEITHKVMRCATVLDIIADCARASRDYRTTFQQQIIGQVVLTDYNNKTYRIDDVDFDTTPESTFSTKDGDISYIDYYHKKYQIKIRDRKQPMLISRAKARDLRAGQNELMALVPELCRTTGLTDEMRANFRLMKAMSEHTRLSPDLRIQRLMIFNNRLNSTPESTQVLEDWQMRLDTRLVEFPGRIIKRQSIKFANGINATPDEFADWTKEFRNNSLFTSAPLNNWYLIVPNRCQREGEQFCEMLGQAARGMRFAITPPRTININDDRAGSYVQAIESIANSDPQIIMCVVPNNNSDRYSAIKKKCCVDRGIPTQVMVHKTISPKGGNPRSLMSVATKVAIQMNCKLGYAPWSIDIPLSNLMTIGFDVTHDTRDKSLSYGALVATMDLKQSVRYFSAVSSHRNGEELSNELSLNVNKALREYRETHNTLPARIMFFRDGVGDGQIHYVLEHEVRQLKEVLAKAYESAGTKCQLMYIIVSKRINTRIFANNKNPVPGTVADDVITLPERYDFFLVSQCVRQGTVSPTSYNVIFDEWGLSPDQVQTLTYRFCHLYYNWSGTVRVPALCQYAHKLAFLVGQYIHQAPSNHLERRLYYL